MAETEPKVNIYWVEEQEIFQKLYAAVFTFDSPVKVLGYSSFDDFTAISNNIISCRPEILLVGCKYISKDLLKELGKLQTEFPQMGIVLLASVLKNDDLRLFKQHLETTKSPFGFLFKKSLTHSEQLFSIISLVKMGQMVIDPSLSKIMVFDREKLPFAQGLTGREMEVLNLIAKSYTNTAISDKLCIDVKTVRHHINNIYSKIQTTENFDNRHPRVSATNAYLRLTGQLAFDDDEDLIED
jgi:two-component system, NarL family, response regulator LiaR